MPNGTQKFPEKRQPRYSLTEIFETNFLETFSVPFNFEPGSSGNFGLMERAQYNSIRFLQLSLYLSSRNTLKINYYSEFLVPWFPVLGYETWQNSYWAQITIVVDYLL